jgi:hypothetical protein
LASSPYLRESPKLPALPDTWDHIPSLRELQHHRSAVAPTEPFPVYPGLSYMWVLAKNKARAKGLGYAQLKGVDLFMIADQPTLLMAKGEPIAELSLDTAEPVLSVDPELFKLLHPDVKPPREDHPQQRR